MNTRNDTQSNHGEGNPEAARAYNQAATDHVRHGNKVERAAREAANAVDAAPAAHAHAERAGKQRAREYDPAVSRPDWWVDENESTWERVKTAVKRDWEQTLADLSGGRAGEKLDQGALDTLREMTGATGLPPEGEPAAVTSDMDWVRDQPATEFGYFAARHYTGPWSPKMEAQLASDWGAMGAGAWTIARPSVYIGWRAYRRNPDALGHGTTAPRV